MTDGESSGKHARRMWWIVAAVVVVVAATGGIVGGLVATSSDSSTSPQHNCASSGCGLVSQSLTLVQPTGFYGASCTGVYGSWFLKVMQEGEKGQLRANYDLKWEFSRSDPVARPSGTIVVRPKPAAGSGTSLSLTLHEGELQLNGTDTSGKAVHGTGTLTVRASGGSKSPRLKFVETGLSSAEKAVGFNSPFDVDGKPLILLIRNVKVLVGCSR